jgi:hypothetical protein
MLKNLLAASSAIRSSIGRKPHRARQTNGQLIIKVLELDEDERRTWKLTSCSISGDQMAVLSQTKGQERTRTTHNYGISLQINIIKALVHRSAII